MKSPLRLLTVCKVVFNDESVNCSVSETPATESSAVAFFLWFDFIYMCQDSGKLPIKILPKASEGSCLL